MRQGEIGLRKSIQRELLAAYGAPTEHQTLRLIVGGVFLAGRWRGVRNAAFSSLGYPPSRTAVVAN
jgi:hypothetical protein